MPLNNMNGPAGNWKAAHDVELERLAKTGMSYRDIASEINAKFGTVYSKNSVIGRAGRIGIVKKPASSAARSGPAKPREPRPQRARTEIVRIVPANGNSNVFRAFRTVAFEPLPIRCAPVEPRNLTLADLQPHDCRYPYGDGPSFTFCGHTKLEGSSYCPDHFMLCREEPRKLTDKRFARAA